MRAIVITAAIAISGCATSNLRVVAPATSQTKFETAELVYVESAEKVPSDKAARTTALMRTAFFEGKSPAFREGPGGLTVRYGFDKFSGGNRAVSLLVGLGAGGAKTVLNVEFLSPGGVRVGEVQASGKTGIGIYGGNANTTLRKAVSEVQTYAVTNFR